MPLRGRRLHRLRWPPRTNFLGVCMCMCLRAGGRGSPLPLRVPGPGHTSIIPHTDRREKLNIWMCEQLPKCTWKLCKTISAVPILTAKFRPRLTPANLLNFCRLLHSFIEDLLPLRRRRQKRVKHSHQSMCLRRTGRWTQRRPERTTRASLLEHGPPTMLEYASRASAPPLAAHIPP